MLFLEINPFIKLPKATNAIVDVMDIKVTGKITLHMGKIAKGKNLRTKIEAIQFKITMATIVINKNLFNFIFITQLAIG